MVHLSSDQITIERSLTADISEGNISFSFSTSGELRSTVITNLSTMILYCIINSSEKEKKINLQTEKSCSDRREKSDAFSVSDDDDENEDNISENISLVDSFNDEEEILKWTLSLVENYIWSVVEDGQLEYASLIGGIIYLNRALKSNPNQFYLTSSNWRNVLSTCFLLSSKMFDDLGMSNSEFRHAFPTSDLRKVNSFELSLCLLLQFGFYINDKEFQMYRRRYESHPTPSSSRRNSRKINPPYLGPSLSSLAYHEKDSDLVNIQDDVSDLSEVPLSGDQKEQSPTLLGTLHKGLKYLSASVPNVVRRKSPVDAKKVYCL